MKKASFDGFGNAAHLQIHLTCLFPIRYKTHLAKMTGRRDPIHTEDCSSTPMDTSSEFARQTIPTCEVKNENT
jgi:hypothetical protein